MKPSKQKVSAVMSVPDEEPEAPALAPVEEVAAELVEPVRGVKRKAAPAAVPAPAPVPAPPVAPAVELTPDMDPWPEIAIMPDFPPLPELPPVPVRRSEPDPLLVELLRSQRSTLEEYGAVREELGRLRQEMGAQLRAAQAPAAPPAPAQVPAPPAPVAKPVARPVKPARLVATTSVQEVKGNIEVLSQKLLQTLTPLVEVEVMQERDSAERQAGMYSKEMTLPKFFEHRNRYVMAYGLANSPLNKMDSAYAHAEMNAKREGYNILQSILHEIDKLSLAQSIEHAAAHASAQASQGSPAEALPADEEPEGDALLVDVEEPEEPSEGELEAVPGVDDAVEEAEDDAAEE